MADLDPSVVQPVVRSKVDMYQAVRLDPDHLSARKIVASNSSDIRSRAFNLLRTRLFKEVGEKACRFVGITSATPAAGKSYLACNLALSLSRVAEAPIFLVDLDLRRGSVAQELGVNFDLGIADLLASDDIRLEDVGLRIDGTPLIVYPTQPVTQNSAELLANIRFRNLMEGLRRSDAGLVICDLPPVFASDDAMLSVEALDGYILVIESGQTTRRQVIEAIEMLTPSRCVGTILNRYRGGLTDDYGYGSAKYERYYST